ncbi:MAG TPA: tetratricopeptide repeat protein [Bryobacteraceae bacterium]|nr:tetratricopeptide repeat protein [Bryobacteraceae bacterium]
MVQRLAILPANVLVNDPSSDWLKIGVPIVLQQDLMTARLLFPAGVAAEANATQNGANQIMRTTVESRQGKIHVEATIVNAATQKTISVNNVDAPSTAEIIPALNALAKRIDGSANDFATKNIAALQSFAGAAAEANPQNRFQLFGRAAGVDPSFGLAFIAMLDMIGPSGEQNAKPFLDQAEKHRDAFTPYDRAKFDLLVTRLKRSTTADQVKAAQAVLTVAPNDMEALAVLGNSRFLLGDVNGGEAILKQALQLNPANENLQNQLAMALLGANRLADAHKILLRLDKNPASLPELASCLLLQGDVAGANAAVERFVGSVSNADLRPVLRATWQAAAGERAKAIAAMETTQFPNKNMATLALSEAAIWRLMDKDYAGAQKTAAQASATPSSFSTIATLLAAANTPAEEWRKKIDGIPGASEQSKRPLLGYGFFLGGHYAESAQIWQQVVDASSGTDVRAKAMLAGALDRAGKTADARKITVQPFVLELSDVYGAVSFTEMRRVLNLTGRK